MNDLLTLSILIACLGDDRFAVRQAAHEALNEKQDIALPVLALHAGSPNPEQRRRVETLLATRRPKNHLTVLLASHQPLPWIDAMPDAIPERWRIQNHYLQQARKLTGNGAAPAWHDFRAATHLWIVDMEAAGVSPEVLDALLARMTRRIGDWDGSTARPADSGRLLDEAIMNVLQAVSGATSRPAARLCPVGTFQTGPKTGRRAAYLLRILR